MQVTFYRHVIRTSPEEARVEAKLVGMVDGEVFEIGRLKFPTKIAWSAFFKATQKGALQVRDFEVRLENAPDTGLGKEDAESNGKIE